MERTEQRDTEEKIRKLWTGRRITVEK